MKIAIIVGTRPEIIKMSPLIDKLEKYGVDNILIHTGQHYDFEMSQQFFQDLELKSPEYNMGVGSGLHGQQTGEMIKKIEEILLEEKPDIVLVEGDTNAVLASAIASSKLNLPVGHVEAGLRSYDKTMPEEINRIVADICSHMYFVPTEKAAIQLLLEGLDPYKIFITGNTIVDACIRNLEIAQKKSVKSPWYDGEKRIITLTLHRAENVDHPPRLMNIAQTLLELNEHEIIFPVHPRTRKNLEKLKIYEALQRAEHIHLIKPLGYLDFLLLLSESWLVLTDSGGIQEEAITLKVPCLTLRYNTERPETVDAGGNILVGTDKSIILQNIRRLAEDDDAYNKMKKTENPYGDGKASKKIIEHIQESYKSGELKISPPQHIQEHREVKLIRVYEKVSVEEIENESKKVRLAFKDGIPVFPYRKLDLKDSFVLLEIFH